MRNFMKHRASSHRILKETSVPSVQRTQRNPRSSKQCIYLQLLLMSFCHLYEDLDKTALLADGPVPLLHTVVLFTQVS